FFFLAAAAPVRITPELPGAEHGCKEQSEPDSRAAADMQHTEAFQAKNFDLAADIYECQLAATRDPDTRLELMVKLADALAFGEKFSEALDVYRRASEVGRLRPAHLNNLIDYLSGSVRRQDSGGGAALGTTGTRFESFSCRICLSFLFEPATLPCGHSFCKKCLERERKERERPVMCRDCGRSGDDSSGRGYRVNVVLSNLLAKWFPSLHQAGLLRRQGNGMYAERRMEAALDKYNQAILIVSMDHILFSNRSQIHSSLKNYDEALKDAETACRLMPHWSRGHVRKAQTLVVLGSTEEALREYLVCLSIEPDCRLAKAEAHKVNLSNSVTTSLHHAKNVSLLSVEIKYDIVGSRFFSQLLSDLLLTEGAAIQNSVHDYVDPTDLECSLCMRLLYEPVTTPCGHTFCLQCLERCLDHNPKCPLCKEELSEYLVQRQYCKTVIIEMLISKYLPSELMERQKIHHDEMTELSNLNKNVPIFVCTMAFPTVPCPLHIFEPCYRLMIRRCMETGTKCFGMCLSDDRKGFADYGCLLEIRDVKFFSDGRSVVDTIGRRRFKVVQHSERDGYNTADIEYLEDVKVEGAAEHELQSLHDAVYDQALIWVNSLKAEQKERIEGHFGPLPEKDSEPQACPNGPSWCWWLLAVLPLEGRAQLPFLALTSLKDRLSGIRKVLLFMTYSRHR
uniref:LON peptidase N-terminal domain and ring finger 3 n=1 Tax=Gouania willdenowi TaxID=441366 RepID=A0A8C5D8X3_GOUWI